MDVRDGLHPERHDSRVLGRSPVEVSTLGFGAAPLGGFRGPVEEADAAAMLHAALDAGITYFDTSPYYGYGRSELRVGATLRESARERFVVSTKVGRCMERFDETAPPPDRRPGGLRFTPRFDYGAHGTLRSLEQSMMRLGLPDIDIVYIHDVDVFTHGSAEAADAHYRKVLQGCYPTLERLRAEGVIKAIGVGLNETERSLRFVRDTDIDCVLLAGRYTLLEQGALDGLLPECAARGVSLVIGGPFNSGVLATGPIAGAKFDYGDVPEGVADRVRRLHEACAEHRVDPVAAALQFPLAHPAVASVIPGPMEMAHLRSNLAGMRATIPRTFWADLRDRGLLDPRAPAPGDPPR